MLSKRSTLKDIAEALNVSVTTVSRALNDKDDISVSMRNKVLETARLLDYKPNTIARSLRKKTSSKVIGLIIPQMEHYYYSTIVKGVTLGSQDDGFLVMIGESGHSPQKELDIINQYTDHYVAGIIFVPSRNQQSITNISALKKRRIPSIIIDRVFEGQTGSYITHDDYNGAYKATEHLIKKGRKRIALLRGHQGCSVSQNRYQGYRDAHRDFNVPLRDDLIAFCPIAAKEEAVEQCEHLWKSADPPDAIFTITDLLAAGVYEFAYKRKINIPSELAVVGYSNSEISDILYPRLTTVNQNGQELGSMAKKHLQDIIQSPALHVHRTIPTELIIRNSS